MKNYDTKNKTAGLNTCEFIILHHTATKENTLNGLISAFTGARKVSAHYLIDETGEVHKFWNDKDILWHAWLSKWGNRTDLNNFSIGIEVIGPLTDGGFTDEQRKSVETLIKELVQKYAIPKENILRHRDIAPGRKYDISDTFWNKTHKTWEDFRDSLFFKKTKYTDLKNKAMDDLKKVGLDPIFTSFTGENPLSEQEVKELIEIATAKVRLLNK